MIRVVFDTVVVVSALVFSTGPAGQLREMWRSGRYEGLVSRATLDELVRVLADPKFELSSSDIEELLADFLPWTRTIRVGRSSAAGLPRCRDRDDQKFLELAAAGKASRLVTGDRDLLALAGRTPFRVLTVAEFLRE